MTVAGKARRQDWHQLRLQLRRTAATLDVCFCFAKKHLTCSKRSVQRTLAGTTPWFLELRAVNTRLVNIKTNSVFSGTCPSCSRLLLLPHRKFCLDVFEQEDRICPSLHVVPSLKRIGAERPEFQKLFGCVVLKHKKGRRSPAAINLLIRQLRTRSLDGNGSCAGGVRLPNAGAKMS